ncbi:NAD-glutamate dehydrogenase domain-containing protein [Vibrio breoganii]|uniref:NAD-glutamate dehydrogenase domain-containing protein n=1 Tax=Vibrio breoganii TaxID=553239 RepID=UPI0039A60296
MRPSEIPDIPAPVPAFEILFTCTRTLKVCIYVAVKQHVVVYVGQTVKRIGTEILGLVKAQQAEHSNQTVGKRRGFLSVSVSI